MTIRDYRGLRIQVCSTGKRIIAESYRKNNLLQTIQDPNGLGEPFQSDVMALKAAKDWIDRTYPKGRIRYVGEQQPD